MRLFSYSTLSVKKFFLNSLLYLMLANSQASSSTNHELADEHLGKLYHSMANISKVNVAARLNHVSNHFLGKPYILGALGEGKQARFDQSPLYRTDGFDCETYVTTVIAIALTSNPQEFKQCLRRLRYHQGHIDFIYRNHFTELDWNSHNHQQGFVNDITESIRDEQQKKVAKIASAIINKPGWYRHFTVDNIKLTQADQAEQNKRLNELKALGQQLTVERAQVPYIPLEALFDSQGKPNLYLFAQIPHAAIIEIVRPNWDLTQKIGTHLNISHLGFAFWQDKQLIFRQASSQYNKVVEVSLVDYLSKARTSPTIKGINIQVVKPHQPLA